MKDVHEGVARGHYAGKETTHKIMDARLWWPTIFQDTKDYCKSCEVCQCVGKQSKRDHMPLNL